MSFLKRLTALLVLSAATLAAGAQPAAWPSRPVRWIVPFGAGGSADAVARYVAQKLSERWGQPVNVDNKPGGNTIVAAAELVRAAPDGYTLLQSANSTLTMNPFAVSKLPYDVQRDIAPIGVLVNVPMIWVANDKLPARTMQEFVAYAKANPDTVTVGWAGPSAQVAVESFARDWGLKMRLVPYKSGVDITRALQSGEVQVGFDGVLQYIPLIKVGRLRGLATASAQRVAALGNVPTLAETGLKKSDTPIWHALVTSAGVPASVRARIAADLQQVMALPDVRDRIVEMGMEPMWEGPDEFARLIRSESAVMGPLVKELGIRMD